MSAIWPVGPPKFTNPSHTQNRNASPNGTGADPGGSRRAGSGWVTRAPYPRPGAASSLVGAFGTMPPWEPTRLSFTALASTTSRTSPSSSRATRWSSSPGSRARGRARSRSTRSTPRGSAATSSRSRRTPGSSSARWRSPTSTSSRGSRRRSRSTRSPPPATRGRRWGPSPRSTTTSGCCTRGSDTRTAPSAAGRSAARRPSRSSTRSCSCPRGPGSRCSRRWSGGARASTRSS